MHDDLTCISLSPFPSLPTAQTSGENCRLHSSLCSAEKMTRRTLCCSKPPRFNKNLTYRTVLTISYITSTSNTSTLVFYQKVRNIYTVCPIFFDRYQYIQGTLTQDLSSAHHGSTRRMKRTDQIKRPVVSLACMQTSVGPPIATPRLTLTGYFRTWSNSGSLPPHRDTKDL